MTNLALLAVCFLLGVALRQSGRMAADGHKAINAFIINVALPALVLRTVHDLRPSADLVFPAVMPWIMFAVGALVFVALGRILGWTRQTTGGLILAGGLANTSFVGLPMIEAFYGPRWLGVGILADQLGTYMVLSTLGVVVATVAAATGRISAATVLRRIAVFAPLQALVLGLLLAPFPYPAPVGAVLDRLGGTLTPLALVSVGFQLRLGDVASVARELGAGLAYKLVLGPAVIALLFVSLLHASGQVIQVTVFEAAMGPQIGGAIVAIEHGLNPRLVGLMVGVGIPLSIGSAALWSRLLVGV